MKVKVLYIGARQWELESALQAWLDNNQNAKIEHVTQTPVASDGAFPGITSSLLVTIFYRD